MGYIRLDLAAVRSLRFSPERTFFNDEHFKVLLWWRGIIHVDAGQNDSVAAYSQNDLVEYSPVTEKHLTDGMTVENYAVLPTMVITAATLGYDNDRRTEGANRFLHNMGIM